MVSVPPNTGSATFGMGQLAILGSVVPGEMNRFGRTNGCQTSDVDEFEVAQIREAWREITDAAGGFVEPGWYLVGTDDHTAAPSGWVGIVDLFGSLVIASP